MNRATVFATFDCGQNVLHIYDDGFALVLACSHDRFLEIREELKTIWPDLEEARSQDGSSSVFVLPGTTREFDVDPLLMRLSDDFHDHRREAWHTLDMAVELMWSETPSPRRFPRGKSDLPRS
jgi:hypothetical protein